MVNIGTIIKDDVSDMIYCTECGRCVNWDDIGKKVSKPSGLYTCNHSRSDIPILELDRFGYPVSEVISYSPEWSDNTLPGLFSVRVPKIVKRRIEEHKDGSISINCSTIVEQSYPIPKGKDNYSVGERPIEINQGKEDGSTYIDYNSGINHNDLATPTTKLEVKDNRAECMKRHKAKDIGLGLPMNTGNSMKEYIDRMDKKDKENIEMYRNGYKTAYIPEDSQDISKSMNKWRKEYNNKFKNGDIFWEMFFKELEKQLIDNR